jgi:RHS repeat-associated protein
VDNGRTQSYTYDDLSRVLTASSQATSGSDCWGQSFTIDAVANLTGIATTQCSATPFSAAVNGNNQFTTGYTYDAAGNLTNDGLYAYTYNAENEITTANGVSYTYDGNRMRVKKSSGTLYWRDTQGSTIAETNLSGTNVNEYVFFAGRRAVQRDASGNLYYYQADHGRSARSITKVPASGSASICYDADFTPYGAEMGHTSTCAPNYKFTGYEHDSETGLDYAMNRFYNSRMGRFMSPDPIGLTSANFNAPQSLNRYAYVLNNPLSAIDPSGLTCVWDDGSYDAFDDQSTGSPTSCAAQGGTWFEGNTDDYNPNGNSFLANMVSVAQNMGWGELSQDQQVGIANFVKDVSYIRGVFNNAVSYMDKNGLRRPGSGAVNGLLNDLQFWVTNYQACTGQSYIVDNFLKAIPSDALNFRWTFTEESDFWHTWVEGSYGGFSNVMMDPLYGTFTIVPDSYLGASGPLGPD